MPNNHNCVRKTKLNCMYGRTVASFTTELSSYGDDKNIKNNNLERGREIYVDRWHRA